MSYNYKNEYKKWFTWKEKEEELLKELNVPEKIIKELREYDYEQGRELCESVMADLEEFIKE